MSGGFLGPLRQAFDASEPERGSAEGSTNDDRTTSTPPVRRDPTPQPSARPQARSDLQLPPEAQAYAARLLANTIFTENHLEAETMDRTSIDVPQPAPDVRQRFALETTEGVLFELTEPSLVVGRGVVDDPMPRLPVRIDTVSRRHLEITDAAAGHQCSDLGSSNGTVIRRSGHLLQVGEEPVTLQDGDLICTLDGKRPIARYRVLSTGGGQ